MNRFKLISILVLVFLIKSGVLFSEIREIKSMREIAKELTPQTLLVFDLDNTLIEPIQSLGSDQWYYYLIRKYKEVDKLSDDEAYKKADIVWNNTLWLVEPKAVEEMTPRLIKHFQQKGIKMMGLTARTFDTSEVTTKQLKSVGIQFKNPIYSKNLEFKLVDMAKYTNGILYIGEHNDKGKVLIEFLKQIHSQPKKIVFVDDKQKHTVNMERALRELNIKHIEFRYGAADQRVANFNKDFEDFDLFCNGNWTPRAEEKRKALLKEK